MPTEGSSEKVNKIKILEKNEILINGVKTFYNVKIEVKRHMMLNIYDTPHKHSV